MNEVNAELYKVLQNNECHLYCNSSEGNYYHIAAWVCLHPLSIKDFYNAVGHYYFDEEGAECRMITGGYIAIDLNDIIENEEHLISSYGDCFEEWKRFKDRLLEYEKELN